MADAGAVRLVTPRIMRLEASADREDLAKVGNDKEAGKHTLIWQATNHDPDPRAAAVSAFAVVRLTLSTGRSIARGSALVRMLNFLVPVIYASRFEAERRAHGRPVLERGRGVLLL
jgi:hypothetical protein